MGKIKQNIVKGQKVVAIVRQEEGFKAVCLSKKSGQINVLWTKSSGSNGVGWQSFATECGLTGTAENKSADDTSVVIGFNCAGVVFYHLDVPAVREDEISQIIQLQTESRLPLPAEQVEISFRTNYLHNGSASVTVAAAKKILLQSFVNSVKEIRPEKIMLDCEATAKIWTTFFPDRSEQAVVVNVESSISQLCLVEAGKLKNAVILDSGASDFIDNSGSVISEAAVQRFAHDLSGTLNLFGFSPKGAIPVYILSCSNGFAAEKSGPNEQDALNNIAALLCSSGFNAKAADLSSAALPSGLSGSDISVLYDYRLAAGLALMSLDADRELNIFENLYISDAKVKKSRSLSREKKSVIIATAMLAVTIMLFYLLDELNAHHLEKLKTTLDYSMLNEKYRLSEVIGQNRPDLLELMGTINSVEAGSIVLDSFDFRKGQSVKITGTAQSSDQLYKFEADLNKLKSKGLDRVNITSAQEDERNRRLKFTVTFDYRNFSKKQI
jgi:hypothetical protein